MSFLLVVKNEATAKSQPTGTEIRLLLPFESNKNDIDKCLLRNSDSRPVHGHVSSFSLESEEVEADSCRSETKRPRNLCAVNHTFANSLRRIFFIRYFSSLSCRILESLRNSRLDFVLVRLTKSISHFFESRLVVIRGFLFSFGLFIIAVWNKVLQTRFAKF